MREMFPLEWTADLAYVVGLITTDGNLSKDGRHLNLTSKDIDQLENFATILKLDNKIGVKTSGFSNSKYYQLQFGNVRLYRFLLKIGLIPAKSKSLGVLKIPNIYFADFLRGCLDGDGYTYSYWDRRWKSSFMLYTGFVSASIDHLKWIEQQIFKLYNLRGAIKYGSRAHQLNYAKHSSIKLLTIIYYRKDLICLNRKYLKIQAALGIMSTQAGVGKLEDPLP